MRGGGKAESFQGFLGHAQQFAGRRAGGQIQGRLIPLVADACKEGSDRMFIGLGRETIHRVAGMQRCNAPPPDKYSDSSGWYRISTPSRKA